MKVYKLIAWHDFDYFDLLGIYDTRQEAELDWYNIEAGNKLLPEHIQKEKTEKPGTYIWLQIVEQEDDRIQTGLKSLMDRLKALRENIEDDRISVHMLPEFELPIAAIEAQVVEMEKKVGNKIKKDY
jgi:hypothetical protein